MCFGGSGLRAWLIQRISAVYLGLYVAFLVGYFLIHPQLSYEDWQFLFSNLWMQIGTLTALVLTLLHAWVGIQIVLTDYVKATSIRVGCSGLVLLALCAYLLWGIAILWS